jgi:hypothetical protein
MASMIWIDPELINLIGFEFKVFIPELGRFKSILLSPAEACEYLKKASVRDIFVHWMDGNERIIKTFGSALWDRNGEVALCMGCYSRTPIVCSDGFDNRRASMSGGWYTYIGQMAYPILTIEGSIDSSKGGFCHYEGRIEQLKYKYSKTV